MAEHTVESVKRDLPMVKVKWGKKMYWAKVTGRLCKFACVSPYELIDPRSKLVKTIMGPCVMFSWDVVTRAINEDRALVIDVYAS